MGYMDNIISDELKEQIRKYLVDNRTNLINLTSQIRSETDKLLKDQPENQNKIKSESQYWLSVLLIERLTQDLIIDKMLATMVVNSLNLDHYLDEEIIDVVPNN